MFHRPSVSAQKSIITVGQNLLQPYLHVEQSQRWETMTYTQVSVDIEGILKHFPPFIQ